MKDHCSETNEQKENIPITPGKRRVHGKDDERRTVSQSLRYDAQTLLNLRGNPTAVKTPDPAVLELVNDGKDYDCFHPFAVCGRLLVSSDIY